MNIEHNLNSLENLLNEQIAKVTNKGDITPTELENMTKTLCLLEKIKEYHEYAVDDFDDGMSNAYGRYSRRNSNRDMMYDDYRSNRSYNSYGRMPRVSMSRGYSGHSIKDRMIAKLESMYDEAQSDHEKQIVDEWINRLADR